MLLSCPNCGAVTKIADVLIPSARLTATCSGCGGKIVGTVPARLDGLKSVGKRGEMRKVRVDPSEPPESFGPAAESRPARASGPESAAGPRGESGPTQGRGPKGPSGHAEPSDPPRVEKSATVSRPSLGSVSKGLDPERLAGLVASDMLLYNREKIQKNAADGRLLSSMATEIVEAWEFYKKRVGIHTALGTSYFRDALNKVLADGDPVI